MSENLSILSSRKGLKDNLFENLIQSKGDPINLKQLARDYKVGEASLYGSITAYDFIRGDNANKAVYVCNGSSCLCAQSQPAVKQALLKHYDESQIGHVTCLGRCHENSSFQFKGKNYSGSDIDSLADILDATASSSEEYAVESMLDNPLLTENIDDTQTYYNLLAKLVTLNTPSEITQQIIDSGLRGRGGAGFPTGLKWQSCAKAKESEKYIVCNADEGDPGAFSDRYLMEERPHSVLFGMLVAGYLVGAKWGVLYIRDEYPDSVTAIQAAINEVENLTLLPELNIEFQFKIVRGAGAYICGEETALLRSLEGQRPMVSVRPPFPAEKGLFGKPTIVNNVETFAAVHWILENSSTAFAAIGNGRSTGSKLLSIDSCVNRPGIYEVAMGESLVKIIEYAGGFSQPIKALQIGGPLGGIVPLEKISELTLDFESFQNNGFLLGHASIVGLPETQDMAEYIQHLFDFTAAESCGKCFPCRLGATRGKEMFRDAINGRFSLNSELLNDLLETMEQGSLCALGGGVPLPIKNALQYFLPEMQHLFERKRSERIAVVEKQNDFGDVS